MVTMIQGLKQIEYRRCMIEYGIGASKRSHDIVELLGKGEGGSS